MTDKQAELLPCPFCGNKPVWGLTKKTGCKMHGDPIQYVTLSCKACEFKPSCIGGCRYRGGDTPKYEKEARIEAADKWNTRHALTETKSCGGGGVMEIDIRIAKEILDAFGGEDAKMTLVYWEDGHSGEGYYIYCSDYPEDGAIYLGMAED